MTHIRFFKFVEKLNVNTIEKIFFLSKEDEKMVGTEITKINLQVSVFQLNKEIIVNFLKSFAQFMNIFTINFNANSVFNKNSPNFTFQAVGDKLIDGKGDLSIFSNFHVYSFGIALHAEHNETGKYGNIEIRYGSQDEYIYEEAKGCTQKQNIVFNFHVMKSNKKIDALQIEDILLQIRLIREFRHNVPASYITRDLIIAENLRLHDFLLQTQEFLSPDKMTVFPHGYKLLSEKSLISFQEYQKIMLLQDASQPKAADRKGCKIKSASF